jgi:hypothetical protein
VTTPRQGWSERGATTDKQSKQLDAEFNAEVADLAKIYFKSGAFKTLENVYITYEDKVAKRHTFSMNVGRWHREWKASIAKHRTLGRRKNGR